MEASSKATSSSASSLATWKPLLRRPHPAPLHRQHRSLFEGELIQRLFKATSKPPHRRHQSLFTGDIEASSQAISKPLRRRAHTAPSHRRHRSLSEGELIQRVDVNYIHRPLALRFRLFAFV